MANKNLYEVLGVPPDVGDIQLKRTYRRLAFQYHPDRYDGDPSLIREINDAYEKLSDQKFRARYDLVLQVLREQEEAEKQREEEEKNAQFFTVPHGSVSGSAFSIGGVWNLPNGIIPPATVITFTMRVQDVMKLGLNGLSVGDIVYISNPPFFTSGSMFSPAPPSISRQQSAQHLVMGRIRSVHYGIAPGMPAYGDFEIEVS